MPNAKTEYIMTLKTITLAIFGLITVPSFGQDNKSKEKHPIDIRLDKCHTINSNQTTYGMMNCEAIARDEWNIEMNKYYKLLMDTLQTGEGTKLKASQNAWLSYRDKEMEFSGTMYYNMQGTMWRVEAAGRSCEIVKQRALEIKGYYDMLTIDKYAPGNVYKKQAHRKRIYTGWNNEYFRSFNIFKVFQQCCYTRI